MNACDIRLRFRMSVAFVGILVRLSERFPDWIDGRYNQVVQTPEFLHAPTPST